MNRFRDLFERWHPYWNWECFKAGMWTKRKNDVNKIQQCANTLSNESLCREAMIGAVNAYPISAEQHLSKAMGKRPWIGQAACCFACGATEEETRIAWNFYMTPDAQDMANRVADEVIAKWESCNA
jgi:hypothetical protein